MAVSRFITYPVWNVPAVVRLNTLGDNRYFYIITVTSDDDSCVLRSHFPLEKWHRHLYFQPLPYFCTFFILWLSFWVEQFQETPKPSDILKRKKKKKSVD